MLLVSLVICVGTVRSIVKPVRNMLKATARVAAGERSVVVERGGVRELDTLAAAFNTMAAEVDAARQMDERHKHELEERVEERTRQLKFQAFHDPLTQLPNRRLLFQRLTAAIEEARKSQRIVAVYFLDLDNFKHINDGTGHEFGDALLVACAARLKETVHGIGLRGTIRRRRVRGDRPETGRQRRQCRTWASHWSRRSSSRCRWSSAS